MSERSRAILQLIGVVAAATALVAVIDLLTNSLDTAKFSWDFRYYIDMARRGIVPPLASPFAYRFLTPLIVRLLSNMIQAPVEAGFAILARLAAIVQLVSVFLLARWHSKSARGAWVALLVTAFSLFHVKFLLFDTFRPDHLAYPLILLQVYWAMTRKFWPLWLSTLIACQIREFNAIPLLAFMFAVLWETCQLEDSARRRAAVLQALIAGLGLGLAIALPRLLVHVAEDFQFVSLTRDGLLRAALAPLILVRDANFIYSVVAYALPVLMLTTPGRLLASVAADRWERLFLGTYVALVLVFSFLGGTDFYRFSTYLLPAMVLVLTRLVEQCSRTQLVAMLLAVFIFNRIWLPFPQSDLERYLDFYAGSGTRFSLQSALRICELVGLLAAGWFIRRADEHTRRTAASPR